MEVAEALAREDVPDLTKKLIQSAASGKDGLELTPYESNSHPPFSLYCQGAGAERDT